jgi:hypothetical protein
MEMKGKRKHMAVRRRRGGGPLYFHEGTQKAIVAYQQTKDVSEKEKIYKDDIFPAFEKLVENLIFLHGFNKEEEPFESLKGDCITFLYETIYKFDPNRGSKAFSYFNVVARNWLIIKAKQRSKKRNRHLSLDDTDSLSSLQRQIIENYNVLPAQDDAMIEALRQQEILAMLGKIKEKITNENEMSCIEAIIEIFRRVDELDLLNKRAIFVYIRDLSHLNPKQLSLAMTQIKKYYREMMNSDLEFL